MVELFGTHTRCSSTKGWTGHTLGACGAIEAIICALAIENGFLPGSVNTRDVDPAMSAALPARERTQRRPTGS